MTQPTAAVFCHHQHAGNFELGKGEVVGLRGDPDQMYAAELAARGYIVFAPDAIGMNSPPDRFAVKRYWQKFSLNYAYLDAQLSHHGNYR